VYSGPVTKTQIKQLLGLAIIEIISVAVLIKIPIVEAFYNLTNSSLRSVVGLAPLIVLYAIVQYALVRWVFAMRLSGNKA
jgi:hypothetical protein